MAAQMAVLSADQMVVLMGRQTVGSTVLQKDTKWEALWVDWTAVYLDSGKAGPTAPHWDYSKVSKMAHLTADQWVDRMESSMAAVSDRQTAGKMVVC
mmetsp:Transcript_32496/g.60691  ORF Transcript_32496/g.60691 Transcript_32496/m.60691 type:complete len:97 (-) Transcript_32496:1032-1322(-)